MEQFADVNGIRRTIIPSPENQKVGASNYEEDSSPSSSASSDGVIKAR
jgi:hypothetical protein